MRLAGLLTLNRNGNTSDEFDIECIRTSFKPLMKLNQRTGTVPLLLNHTQKALLVDIGIIKDIQERNELRKKMRVLKRRIKEKSNLANHLFKREVSHTSLVEALDLNYFQKGLSADLSKTAGSLGNEASKCTSLSGVRKAENSSVLRPPAHIYH